MTGALLLAWNLGALGVLAYLVAARCPASWSRWLRATAALTLAGSVPVVLLWVGSIALPLSASFTAVALTALAAGVWYWGPSATEEPDGAAVTPGWWAGWVWFCGGLGLWTAKTTLLAPTFKWDDLSYHLSNPAWWVTTGRLEIAPWSYQATYPMHAELFTAWLMLPLHADAHIGLAPLLWAVLSSVGMVALSRNLEQPLGAGLAASGLFLCSSGMSMLLGVALPIDLAGTAWVVAMLAFATAPAEERSALWAGVLLSGLAAGAAVGTRVMNLPPAFVVGLFWLRFTRSRPAIPLTYAGLVAMVGGIWYLRNWAITGNPLFPAVLGPFDGPFDPVAQRETSMLPFLVQGWDRPRFWMRLLELRWDWPYSLGILSALGWLAAGVRGLRERRKGLLLVLAVVTIALFLFPTTPFSGTPNRPDKDLHGLIRYLAMPFGLGLVLSGSLLRHRLLPIGLGVVGLVSLTALETHSLPWIVGSAGVGALAGLLAPRPGGRPLLIAGVAAGLALVVGTPARQAVVDQALFDWRGLKEDGTPKKRRPGEAWRILDDLPPASRIAAFSPMPFDNTFVYPYFGRDQQHRPVPISASGSELPPLYARWEDEPRDWWWRFDPPPSIGPEQFVSNLLDAEVDYVFVHKCQAGHLGWPIQRSWMESTGHRPIHKDPCARIYDMRSDKASGSRRPSPIP